jgi:hypothetical protein
MFAGGSYIDPRVQILRTAFENKQSAAISNVVKTSELPVREEPFRVSITGTLEMFQANRTASIWSLDAGSGIHTSLMNVGENGEAVGDLTKCLIHKVEVSNMWSNADQEMGFVVKPFAATKRTRDNRTFSGTIVPGFTRKLQKPVYERTDAEVNLAQIDMQGFTRQDIEESLWQMHMPSDPPGVDTWVVKKGSRVAKAIYNPLNLEKNKIFQQNLHLKAGKPLSTFKPTIPFDDPGKGSPVMTVIPEYGLVAKESALELADKLENEVNPYLTSLYDLAVEISPLECSWDTVNQHLSITSAHPMVRETMTSKSITVSMDLIVRYTVCDGPNWSALPAAKTPVTKA